MAVSLVKNYSENKQFFPKDLAYDYFMNEAAKTFAKNLRLLMEYHDVKQHELSRMSDVAQKTISNMLNPGDERSPNLENISKIAKAFKLQTWHVLIPDMPPEMLYNSSIEKIVHNFILSDQNGRDAQLRISETTAGYSQRLTQNTSSDNDKRMA